MTLNWEHTNPNYTGKPCQLCGRNRVEIDGVCEKCQYMQKCETCGQDATCFGSYDNKEDGYACDDCCGHGGEDGFCNKLLEREDRIGPR